MLVGLRRAIGKATRQGLDEAQVYGQASLWAGSQGEPFRRGLLCCPICGARAMRFRPFGLAGRPNAVCPGCGSVERHRFLWLYLATRTRLLSTSQRVLHTAPERCLEPRLRALPNWRYASIDKFDPLADITADLTDIPLRDASVDGVISSHVLEHIPDDEQAMAELARVVRPGGWAIILVPYDPKLGLTEEGRTISDPAERMARFGHPYHYRIPGADYPDRLRAAGFDVRVVDSRRAFTPHMRRKYRINRNFLFDCRRRPVSG